MKLTPEKLTAFCAALAETAQVGKACKAVDISRYTAYKWRQTMPEFALAWDDAMAAALLGLEDEAHRRAFDGCDDPLVHQGQFTYLRDPDSLEHMRNPDGSPMVATVKKYSDTLAIFLLKAHSPDKYRDNSKLELSGSLALSAMSEEEIREELATLTATLAPTTKAPDGFDDLC